MANQQRRVPNLQELDEREAYSFLTDVFFAELSPEAVYEANHPEDYAMEMPQSGERIRGRENMRHFHEVMILELKDGRIWRDRRYYAAPFEAPEWRAQWVERVEF